MISKTDIKHFFDFEAETARREWELKMGLSVKERIRKRQTIQAVYLNSDYQEKSSEPNHISIKVSISENLSDFKEGDPILLHKEDSLSGIKCTLNSFDGDSDIILDIYRDKESELSSYYNMPLLLDKDYVDLRETVFNKFIAQLPDEAKAWNKNIFNTMKAPQFKDKENCEEELEDTIKNFELKLEDKQREAIINCMSAEDYYLVQGPPGTGKSFVLSIIILEELLYFKHKVVVIGPNHKAINNTLDAVVKIIPFYAGRIVKIGQKYNAATYKMEYNGDEVGIVNDTKVGNLSYGDESLNDCNGPVLIGLTPHSLYSSRGSDLKFDTLIIDEAGQISIPLALMGMIKAKKTILAGDSKQLSPIIVSKDITGEMSKSAFQQLMSDSNCTMLNVSFRMCKVICDYVSDLFYAGKISSKEKGDKEILKCSDPQYSFDTPIVIKNIADNGEQTSDKEASFITELIETYLNNYRLNPKDIAVLTPFRAQAANIRKKLNKIESLDKTQLQHVTVDTIDRMQGQERKVIILSMTSGNPDYISDMAEFLYNPNKLNVAFSRAMHKLIIVGNIEQIRKVSTRDYPHILKMIESNFVKHL